MKQIPTVMVETTCITAGTQVIQSYSPDGANVHPPSNNGSLGQQDSAAQTVSQSVHPVLQGLLVCSTHGQTNMQTTERATCDMCSNRPRLCDACDAAS